MLYIINKILVNNECFYKLYKFLIIMNICHIVSPCEKNDPDLSFEHINDETIYLWTGSPDCYKNFQLFDSIVINADLYVGD